jgi:hypothetical protein
MENLASRQEAIFFRIDWMSLDLYDGVVRQGQDSS